MALGVDEVCLGRFSKLHNRDREGEKKKASNFLTYLPQCQGEAISAQQNDNFTSVEELEWARFVDGQPVSDIAPVYTCQAKWYVYR